MQQRRGIAVSPGVAIGPALLFGVRNFRVPQQFIRRNPADLEIARLTAALASISDELVVHERLAGENLGQQYAAIFAAHRALVQDPRLIHEIQDLIRERSFSPEFAASHVLRKYAKSIQNLGDQYLAERASDLFDLEKRILQKLHNESREELADLESPVVVLAHNLTPSETANLDKKFVLGFATEAGGKSSHTAILAGALEIPAVVGVGDFLADVSVGNQIIIDGNTGLVIIDPDEQTLAQYRIAEQTFRSTVTRLKGLSKLESKTRDNVAVHIYGNIEFPDEVPHCTDRGAEGIGLFRTEFLFMGAELFPSEETQYEAYSLVTRGFPGQPVTIRTLDLGAEKFPESMQGIIEESDNPSLGLRGLRLCLQNVPMFKTQLRAILRAAVHGNLRVMFPMVSTLRELRQAKMILKDVGEELKEAGIPCKADLEVGMMVEIPSAALLADRFASEVDFFSIGTNDLIQYTLGVDRANPAVAGLYSSADPSLIRLIGTVMEAAREADVSVTVCGQMSSDPIYTALLVGMGIRELSVTPHVVPEIKQVVMNLTIPHAREIAEHVKTFDLARDVENYLRGELRKLCPEVLQ